MKNIQRLFLAILAIIIHTPSSFAGDLYKLKLATDWYPQPEHGGYYYALAKGYYKQEGLDVEIIPASPSTPVIPRVMTGGAQIGLGSADDVLFALNEDLPLIAVGATMEHDPLGIMVHADSAVNSLEDLEGKTVATDSGARWFLYLCKRYHFKNAKQIPLQYSVAPFLHDSNYICQCFVTSEPFFVRKAGAFSRTMLLSEAGYSPYRVYYATRDFVKKHPDAVRGFMKASIRGWKEYLNDPLDTFKQLMKLNPELSPDKMDFSFKALKEGNFITGDEAKGESIGLMQESRWKAQFELLRDLNLLKADLDYHAAFTTGFFPGKL